MRQAKRSEDLQLLTWLFLLKQNKLDLGEIDEETEKLKDYLVDKFKNVYL